MKRKISVLLLVLALAFALTACGGKKQKIEVGDWETQKVNKTYTLSELSGYYVYELKALKNSYIRIEFELDYIDSTNV
jgi:ABC-type glycerol-3-phosphate transport system substrate-binding protein